MTGPDAPGSGARLVLRTAELSGRERYQLLTSLVVPRPIAWVSRRSPEGRRNLAPFSYFAALSATPFLVGVSVGHRGGAPKDTLRNVRDTGVFCVNVVTEDQLLAMNETSGEFPPEVDEFERAGIESARAETVDAPYVAACPAVLECRLFKEVELEGAPNTLLIGEVLGVRLSQAVRRVEGTLFADTESLRPVARLWGDLYSLVGETPSLARPRADARTETIPTEPAPAMIPPADLRVPRSVLDEPDPEQLVWKVIEPAWNAVDVGGDPDAVDAQLAGLTPGQRALFAISWCVSEVENGGFEQFFANPAGVLAREAREGFARVREVELASVVDQVAALLPGDWPARERRVRNFQLARLRGDDDERVAAFEPYDQAFYDCLGLEELTGACAAYVLKHPEEFVRD